MNHVDRIRICERCTNRKVNPKIGMTCGLTDQVPAFEESCDFFQVDAALDFQMKMMEENEARNKKNSKRVLLFMGIGLPLLCLLGWGAYEGEKWWKNHQVEKEAKYWGVLLEEDMEENAGNGIPDRLDLYQIMNRATHNGKKSALMVSFEGESGFLKKELTQVITQNFSSGIHIKQININVLDERAFILYRFTYPNSTVDYIELELKRVDGELKIVDAFSFLRGEYLTETLYQLLPRDDFKLPGNFDPSAYRSAMNRVYHVKVSLAKKEVYNAQNNFKSLNNRLFGKEKFYIIADYEVDRALGLLTLVSDLDRLLKKSQDTRFRSFVRLLQMSHGADTKNLDKELATIRKYVGDDAYIKYLEIKARSKDTSKTCEDLRSLYNDLSRDIYYLEDRIECELKDKNKSEAKKLIDKAKDVYPEYVWSYYTSQYPDWTLED